MNYLGIIITLGRIGDPRAIEPLQRIAEEGYLKRYAEEAIRKIEESTREKK